MLKRRLSSQAGQALVIAVLLLILMAVLSAVFVAFVAHSIAQAGRRIDVEAAERMSVAGVLFAHRQLLTSPDQASWRPAMPAWYNPMAPQLYYSDAEISRGFAMNFPPFVKIDDPVASGENPYAMGSAGEQQLGRCLLQVSYVPSYFQFAVAQPWGTWTYPTDPATGLFDELSPFIKITAVGSARQQPDLMRTKVAYVPVVLPDRLATIVDSEETYRWASFGTPPWVDINGDGLLDGWEDTNNDGVCEAPDGTISLAEVREFGVGRLYGGVHSNTSMVWYGRTWLDELKGDRQFVGVGNTPGNGGRGDRVSVAGLFAVSNPPFGNQPANWECGARFSWCDPMTGLLGVGGVYPSRLPDGGGPAPTWDHNPDPPTTSPTGLNEFPVYAGYVQDNLGLLDPTVDDAVRVAGYQLDVNRRMAQRVRAGLLDATDEAGSVRLRNFARDSGWRFEILAGSGTPLYPAGAYNTALFGLGNTLYVDNAEDVQALDPQALHDNWMHAGAQADAFWYGPVYVPPGCEVTLYERDIAANWAASPIVEGSVVPPQRLYGNRINVPDIEMRRAPTPSGASRFFSIPVTGDAHGNGLADAADVWNPLTMPTTAIVGVLPLDIDPADGVPDDRIIVDYPTDGCLYFEGNVRVQGRLPISRMDVLDGTGFPRRFDLSLVSRQTIYVDGNLMRGLDWLPGVTTDAVGIVTQAGYPPYIRQDRFCARAALMAEHNVVVNATRGEYQGPGIETDCEYIPDIAEAAATGGHWLLEPGKSFRTYFGFGGVDLSHPSWMRTGAPADNPVDGPLNPRYNGPAAVTWRDDVFLKVRVRGSRMSAFNLLINGQPYDFDTRPLNWTDGAGVPYTFAEAPGVSPCKQMDGTVQTLHVPLLINGAAANLALTGAGAWAAPDVYIDGLPGELNSVEIRPALGMTYPLEIYGVSLERRDAVAVAPAAIAGPASGVPLLSSSVPHPWFSWSPENGPPPLTRAGGDVLHSRVMTVAACSYAQKGSFFIIGGDFFDRQAAQVDRNGDNRVIAASLGVVDAPTGVWRPSDVDFDRSGTPDWAEDRRHNLQVQIIGSVNENLPPDITCLADWTDKLSFPVPDLLPAVTQGPSGYAPSVAFWSLDAAAGRFPTGWCGPILAYDPGLRASNPVDPAPSPLAPGALNTQTVCRLPRIPVSPDLIYFGDLAR